MQNQAHKLTELVKEKKQQSFNTKFVAVTSGKGGVGKTTISANLGFTLAKNGYRVALFDADIGLANLDVALGVKTKETILDVLRGEKSLEEIVVRVEENLYLIPGESGDEILKFGDSLILDKFFDAGSMFDQFDFVIIDTGAGIGESVQNFLVASDEIIVVTAPEPSAITDAYALIKIMSEKSDRLNLLINQVKGEKEANSVYTKISSVAQKNISNCNLNLLGALNKDENIEKSIRKRVLFSKEFPQITPTKQLEKISIAIVDNLEHNMLLEEEQGFVRFFRKLLGKF